MHDHYLSGVRVSVGIRDQKKKRSKGDTTKPFMAILGVTGTTLRRVNHTLQHLMVGKWQANGRQMAENIQTFLNLSGLSVLWTTALLWLTVT